MKFILSRDGSMADHATGNSDALQGASIQIDPTFPYYQNRSAQSIADELQWAGYRNVHYFVTQEDRVDVALVETLKKNRMHVWAMVLGNGTYNTTHLPDNWPSWSMELLKPIQDGYYRLSPYSEEFVQWKKESISNMVRNISFDGLEVAEPYFPEWNGFVSGAYGDIGPNAQAAFKQKYDLPIPEFKDSHSPLYYLKNRELYSKWIKFRINGVNDYLYEIFRGVDGAKQVRSDLLISTWSLAVTGGLKSMTLLRELQGLDAVSMIERVKPDIHFFQTHWPDWTRRWLPADYLKQYSSFLQSVRDKFPTLPIGVQTDIGSLAPMRRDDKWLSKFAALSQELGYATWTGYEFHIGKSMYSRPPQPMIAERTGKDEVTIQFNKRIQIAKPPLLVNIYLSNTRSPSPLLVDSAKVDGNQLILKSNELPYGSVELEFQTITDTPDLWLQRNHKANNSKPCRIKLNTLENMS